MPARLWSYIRYWYSTAVYWVVDSRVVRALCHCVSLTDSYYFPSGGAAPNPFSATAPTIAGRKIRTAKRRTTVKK